MSEPTISCPSCRATIPLTESLAAPLIEARVRAARVAIVAEESRRARAEVLAKVSELEATLEQREKKLAEAQRAQAELMRKQRALDDALREVELNHQKRLAEALLPLQEKARREAEEQLGLKVAEKEQTIASMARQIDELRRKAEQGSQQVQGEVAELKLEHTLAAAFPADATAPVPKGEHGGDILQRVASPRGESAGSILWESKRTRHWSDPWLAKLRDDQRMAKAELAVIVTQVLPRGMDSFGLVDGVWVTAPRFVLPVAVCLRQHLLEVAAARKSREGQETKMELVYAYLTGPRFRHRVMAMVEAFSNMQEDLERERKAMLRLWEKRREQIERMMAATVGMYGDLEGIAGRSLGEIEGLELPQLDARPS